MANDEKKIDEKKLARYIADWLRVRNGGELEDAMCNMRVGDFENFLKELEMILKHGGKPPNWIS